MSFGDSKESVQESSNKVLAIVLGFCSSRATDIVTIIGNVGIATTQVLNTLEDNDRVGETKRFLLRNGHVDICEEPEA